MKALELHGVSYEYEDRTQALRELNLSIDNGEKVGIVGPNGAGKSTLLNLVAGFRMPFSGTVSIDGRELNQQNANELRRNVGLVFQDPEDQIFMPTVEEDVAFGPRNLGLDRIDERVMAALRSADIEQLAKRRPQRLSYGMKKRVAIAGILAMEPKILLLDEPTSGLDPKARAGIVKLLKGMDRTMLIATHDLEAAAEIVDRAIVLDVGVLLEGALSDIVKSISILEVAGLELPTVTRLFRTVERMGYPVDSLPVTMDQAVAEMIRVIGREARDNVEQRNQRKRSPKNRGDEA